MTKVFLALGSNVGDSEEHIKKAIDLLGEKVTGIKSAPLYISKAVGYTDQPDFLNTAVEGETSLSPNELLSFTKKVEQKVGRIKRFRWGPREVDIDIIFFGTQIISEPGLHIPHARFARRDFVLTPLKDLDPHFIDPVSKQPVAALLAQLPKSEHSIITKK